MNRISIPGGYEFDPVTGLLFQGGAVLSGVDYEPIYLNTPGGPQFTGIFCKFNNTIVLMNGKIVPNVSDDRIKL